MSTFDATLQVWSLHFDRDLFARVHPRAINLTERRGGNRRGVDFGEGFLQRATEFALDARVGFGGGKRRNLILQRREFLDVGERQKIGARPQRLTDLDKRRPQRDEIDPQPYGLPFESRLLARRAVRAAKDQTAHRANQASRAHAGQRRASTPETPRCARRLAPLRAGAAPSAGQTSPAPRSFPKTDKPPARRAPAQSLPSAPTRANRRPAPPRPHRQTASRHRGRATRAA